MICPHGIDLIRQERVMNWAIVRQLQLVGSQNEMVVPCPSLLCA